MKQILIFVVLFLPAMLSAQSFTAVFEREDDGAQKLSEVCISDSSLEICLVGGGIDECVEFPRASRRVRGPYAYYGIDVYNRATVGHKNGEVISVAFLVNGRVYEWYICESEYERISDKGF